MKIFTVEQIRQLDAFTIENEPVLSIDLMERAARTFSDWFVARFPDRKQKVFVLCGPGNNGGDGLAAARMLGHDFYEVKVFLLKIGSSLSGDCAANLDRLKKDRSCEIINIEEGDPMPAFPENCILVDAIFGSGLSRPLRGYWESFIQHLNNQPVTRVAIDIPSGMFADQPTLGASIRADFTFSFEMPKLGFVFPENGERVGEWAFGSIGLHRGFIQQEKTPWHLVDGQTVKAIYRPRSKYGHKGTYGHVLLVAGSYGKIGAAVLSAKAVLRSGAGLLTVHLPKCGYEILQTAVPEAMVSVDQHESIITEIGEDLTQYKTIGIGCGCGTDTLTEKALAYILENAPYPIVLDADALNMMAKNKSLFEKIPKNSILTPHPKEFERLFGTTANSFERNELQRKKAVELGLYIILKGANTAIACPDGACYFNNTGNPGMATAGSGDVLTGILTGLLAQGYSSVEACISGVWLHGLAGDLAAKKIGQEAMIAGDIVEYFGKAFLKIKLQNLT
ncbi:MAG: NAD(P)H-hydrate dehydratase [Saprospiraceae bacterium]